MNITFTSTSTQGKNYENYVNLYYRCVIIKRRYNPTDLSFNIIYFKDYITIHHDCMHANKLVKICRTNKHDINMLYSVNTVNLVYDIAYDDMTNPIADWPITILLLLQDPIIICQ